MSIFLKSVKLFYNLAIFLNSKLLITFAPEFERPLTLN